MQIRLLLEKNKRLVLKTSLERFYEFYVPLKSLDIFNEREEMIPQLGNLKEVIDSEMNEFNIKKVA